MINDRQIIKANDRATMLNLMTEMNEYTLCSGIICRDLNGGNYVSIPFDMQDTMTIGDIKRKKMPLSGNRQKYIQILKNTVGIKYGIRSYRESCLSRPAG